MTTSLTEFLLARLAEDETVARAALVAPDEGEPTWYARGELGVDYETDDAHIVRFSPARVLAEVEAKRRIVQYALDIQGGDDEIEWAVVDDLDDPQIRAMAVALLALALPHANHPDYDERWRP